MKIVMIRSNPVNPYPRLEKTANTLKKNGHEVHVLAWDRKYEYSYKQSVLNLTDGDIRITRFGIPGKYGGGFKENGIPLLKFQLRLFVWLMKNRESYDAIHAYDFDTGYIALKCSKFFNKRLIYDIPDYYVDSHGLKGTKIGEYVQRAENNVINEADSVIICTEKRKEQIAGTKPRRLTVIHNSPAPNKYIFEEDRRGDFKSNKIKIVYVGILSSGRFIKKIADIVINRSDCELHIGGFGELESYFKQLADANQNIYYYGKIPYNETIELEMRCDVITAVYDPKVPNHYYAAPNKFYEGLMLGKPLIMVKNTGMAEIVEKNNLGEIISYDRDSFEGALNNLIRNKSEWNKIADKSKEIYNNTYSWEIMENRIVDVYKELSNK